MPLTRIKQTAIGADAITTAKLDDTAGGLGLPGTQYVHVPVGNTAQRPSTPANGHLRYNTDFARLEQYAGGAWQAIDSPPAITTLAYSGSNTASDPAGGETITLTGTNFQSGANVTIGGTAASSVTVVSSTSITFVTPAKTAGDYDVVVTNANGLSARLTNGISINGIPAITSPAAGNIGNLIPEEAMTTVTIVAAEPDAGTLAFSVTTGALPSGLSLGSSNGQITGTPATVTSDTTTNFTVTVTDDENQTTTRNYNLVVLRPTYAKALANSIHLADSTNSYLYRNFGSLNSLGAAHTNTWTISVWIKHNGDDNSSTYGTTTWLIGHNTGTNAFAYAAVERDGSVRVVSRNSSSVIQWDVSYGPGLSGEDSNGNWTHYMIVNDGDNAGAYTDRLRVYVNGNRIAASMATQNTTYSQGEGYFNGNALQHYFIGRSAATPLYSDAYIADYHFIDGVAKTDPFEFIENYRGVLVPKTYTGTYPGISFNLDFANPASPGNDVSGNNNDFTSYNITESQLTSSGIGLSLWGQVNKDTPTNNVPHWDQANGLKNKAVNRGGNRTTASNARFFTTLNTAIGYSPSTGGHSGKYYWEVASNQWNAAGGIALGIMPVAQAGRMNADGGDMQNWGSPVRFRVGSGLTAGGSYILPGGSSTNFTTSFSLSTGDVIGMGVDFDNGTCSIWAPNGTLIQEVNISSYLYSNRYRAFYPAVGNESGGTTKAVQIITGHFGNVSSDFTDGFLRTGGIPSGYQKIDANVGNEPLFTPTTNNAPEKAIKCILYEGNGNASNQSITLGFQPDFILSKNVDTTNDWCLYDSCRPNGQSRRIRTNTQDVEDADFAGGGRTLDANGFTVGTSGVMNNTGTHFAWGMKAGGRPTADNSATSGSMTANSVSLNGTLQSSYTPSGSPSIYPKRMSVNTQTGFSMVDFQFPTSGSGTSTIPHGLSRTPDVIWMKGDYDGAKSQTYNWDSYWKYLYTGTHNWDSGFMGRVALNSAGSWSNQTGPWNDTRPTADVFTSSYGSWYLAGSRNIAYCWHAVEGFSDFGHYFGNGKADTDDQKGPFIYTGFQPSLVIIKNVSQSSRDWIVFAQALDNGSTRELFRRVALNQTTAINTTSTTQITTNFRHNGFHLTDSSGHINTLNEVYVYMAFAEMPEIFGRAPFDTNMAA